jgi:DNA modification methylase
MVQDLASCFPDAQIILDPFMGSGTTAIAALNLGKQYIGIELEKEYVDLANQRIRAWTSERV